MEVTRRDYGGDAVEAARSVMLELGQILGAYREYMVIIGGWVPPLLLPEDVTPPHIGSTDIDLAVNHLQITDEVYKTIDQLLLDRGYVKDAKNHFQFFRDVEVRGRIISVQVDLLAGEYGGTGKSRRHQNIQDGLKLRKARGSDLAFEQFVERKIQGRMPNGANNSIKIRVANIVSFITMKAIAFNDRLKEKDAYDIFYCLKHFPGGIQGVADEFQDYLHHGLVVEAIEILKDKFQGPDSLGPISLAVFDQIEDDEEKEIIQRDAFERVNAFLEALEQTNPQPVVSTLPSLTEKIFGHHRDAFQVGELVRILPPGPFKGEVVRVLEITPEWVFVKRTRWAIRREYKSEQLVLVRNYDLPV